MTLVDDEGQEGRASQPQAGSPQDPASWFFTTDEPGAPEGPGTPSARDGGPGDGRRPRPVLDRAWWTRLRALVAAGVAVLLVVGVAGLVVWQRRQLPPVEAVPTTAAPQRTWPSGVWTGGSFDAESLTAFGAYRGSKVDLVTAYPAYETWKEMVDSDWSVTTFDGFEGTMAYGLPLLPKTEGTGTLADVARGDHDDTFGAVIDTLVKHGRDDAYVRIGLEANGDWFPWGVGKAGNNAEDFKAAFTHVAGLIRAKAPKMRIVFDIGCGHVMNGQSDRLDSLTKLYPGDDVVDVVGCDHYDSYSAIARNRTQWANALRPANSAGLQDVVDFARAHGKKWAIPEWGLTGVAEHGGGDNPFFIYEMYMFFAQNAKDLAFENYFNEPDTYLQSSIWKDVQHPLASAEYAQLW